MWLFVPVSNFEGFLCHTEQLEAFKKHMEAGETNTSAIIMGEENEDDTENGQRQPVLDSSVHLCSLT